MIDGQSVFQGRDRVMMQQVEGELVLLDIDSGEYFALNEVGGRIWELCDGSRSVRAVADVISAEYDVASETVVDDACE
ncbi:MAG TPA: PqqD family protein, partial [Acidimicrobiales bacterium]|nr:PqqD family protein [Acidimicrobiales bacterium]